jgi:glucuronoarabinoxylan endo-1,4-beta-xylanase
MNSRPIERWLGLLVLALLPPPSHAGVTVAQNVSVGATIWPGSPIISTVSDPSSQATVSEEFGGPSTANTNLSETFTITTTNYTLQTIDIYAGGGTGTSPSATLTLNLYDLGTQTAPNPSPYTASIAGANLFGSGAGLPVSYSSQTAGVLEFDFTGADQVTLQQGHMYAFELTGVSGTTPVAWYRTTSDTYSGGAAYRNQSWINGNNARDFSLAVYATSAAGGGGGSTAQCTVDYNNVHQRIDGFGASSAWRSTWTTAQANMFFSTNSGTGVTLDGKTNFSFNGVDLSLLRTRIAPGGTTIEQEIMTDAQALGARVWSAPWSPATQFKSNTNIVGGSFVGTAANYQAYANQQASYVANMKSQYGINLYAISVQNEPDANVTTYESCNWTAQQIHDFVPYLYNALGAAGVGSTMIILPESQNWSANTNLYSTAMQDTNVAADVGIIADHNYDGANFDTGATTVPIELATYGKAEWETEVATGAAFNGSISDGLYWGQRIHEFMTDAQANAWHYWWLIDGNSDNEGLTDVNGYPATRMYVLGNFSRFVRPNFYRIDAANNTGAALISAYKDSASLAFAIVAINTASSAVTQTFNLTNFTAAGPLTPWITSATLLLASQPTVVAANSSFTYTLPAQSVVTFAGNADLAPTNIYLSNASVSEGLAAGAVVGSLSTADPVAGNSFTYTFSSGAGGTDNASFAITNQTLCTAAVLDYQVQNTFSVRLRSTDQNGLWCEQVFPITATFNSQARQIVAAATTADGYLTLTFAGIPGSTCQVLATTNLTPPVSWQAVTNNVDGSTNFVLGPDGLWTNIDFNSTNFPAQFYITVEQ